MSNFFCDTSTGKVRPVIPFNWRRKVFDAVHELSHPGANTTCKLLSSKFVWHGMAKQARQWAKSCLACQRAKIHRHTRAPLATFEVPQRRFDHLNVDLVGPLPPSQGFTHLLNISWICRFGLPADISSDRGAQFTSQLWSAMADLFGSKLHRTTAYHPQANVLVERFHRHMKSALRARLTARGQTGWTSYHGSCWGFAQLQKKILARLLQNWFSALRSPFQLISFPHPLHRQPHRSIYSDYGKP